MPPKKRSKALVLVVVTVFLLFARAFAEEGKPAVTEALATQLLEKDAILQDFYAAREGRPAWQDANTVAGFAAALRGLETDGLKSQDYRPDALVVSYREVYSAESTPAAQAGFDLQVSRILLTALRHLQRGKVDPYRIDTDWDVPIDAPPLDLAAVSQAVDAQRFEQAFSLARPSAAPYERLRAGLARYRHIERQGGWPMLPVRQQALRPGAIDDEVLLLRERLAIIGELEVMATNLFADAEPEAPEPRRYDDHLVQAVQRFQKRHLLETDGIVGPQTRAALNVPVAERIDQIRVNLERARWLLHGLPDSFVLVDIAGYRVSYFRPDGEIWRSRIVVGQPYRRTPSLRSEITHLTVNPSWTVPPTIRREDILPRVRRDPGYLARRNMIVLSPSGRQLNPWWIDWWNPGNVVLRQRPGPNNALGQVVLRFPNHHLVYLHDTPAQGLFTREQRAFSSGCIRVQGILELAQLLFDDTGTPARLAALIAEGKTRNIHLKRPVPVILHYWTVQAGEDGELAFRPDIYRRDAALLAALDRPLTW